MNLGISRTESDPAMNDERPIFKREANGDTQIYFTSEHFSHWSELGLIPRHLIDVFMEEMKRSKMQAETLRKFREKNPDASIKDFYDKSRTWTPQEIEVGRREVQMQLELNEFFAQNWETLIASLESPRVVNLYRKVNPSKNFGVAKVETNCVYHLRDLLDGMHAMQISGDDYLARGEVKTKSLTFALEFDFRAKSQQEADKIVQKFQDMMIGRGLKVWLAFWKSSNERGKSNFEIRISDVMSLLAGAERKEYFKDTERSEFWSIARSLASTRFVMEWPANKSTSRARKKTVERTRFIQQPLLRIFGGEKEISLQCPVKVSVEVLTPEVAAEKFGPALLANGTLRLHPSDVYFSLVIQARAAQTGGKEIVLNWGDTFRMANVSGTAKSNPRKARADVRRKLGRFQKEEIIENFQETRENVRIAPQKYEG